MPDQNYQSYPAATSTSSAASPEYVSDIADLLREARPQYAEDIVYGPVFSCPACGAQLAVSQTAASISCPFCDNNMMLSGRLSVSGNPISYVIPFTVTKDEARECLEEYFTGKPYLPRRFQAAIEDLKAVYVPYYLFDVSAEGDLSVIGSTVQKTYGGGSKTVYKKFKTAGRVEFRKVPADVSERMPDKYMDSITPYDMSLIRPFDPAYAAGCFLELPDVDIRQCYAKVEEQAVNSLEGDLRYFANRYSGGYCLGSGGHFFSESKPGAATMCAMPVWMAHCSWKDEDMLVAVNGTTGATAGDMPVSIIKRICVWTGILVPLLALIIAGVVAMVASSEKGDPASLGAMYSLLAIFPVILAVGMARKADSILMRKMRNVFESAYAERGTDDFLFVLTEARSSIASYDSKHTHHLGR